MVVSLWGKPGRTHRSSGAQVNKGKVPPALCSEGETRQRRSPSHSGTWGIRHCRCSPVCFLQSVLDFVLPSLHTLRGALCSSALPFSLSSCLLSLIRFVRDDALLHCCSSSRLLLVACPRSTRRRCCCCSSAASSSCVRSCSSKTPLPCSSHVLSRGDCAGFSPVVSQSMPSLNTYPAYLGTFRF